MDDSRRLSQILEGLPPVRVLVVGDLILDRYVDGRAGRVSPEAPVLVFEFDSERYLLGGACNVAANLRALGAATAVLGALGDDDEGRGVDAVVVQQLPQRAARVVDGID